MAARKPVPAKPPGRNVEEWERSTERVVLRLPPEAAAQLRARATAEGVTLSAYVARLIASDMAIV